MNLPDVDSEHIHVYSETHRQKRISTPNTTILHSFNQLTTKRTTNSLSQSAPQEKNSHVTICILLIRHLRFLTKIRTTNAPSRSNIPVPPTPQLELTGKPEK